MGNTNQSSPEGFQIITVRDTVTGSNTAVELLGSIVISHDLPMGLEGCGRTFVMKLERKCVNCVKKNENC